MTRRFPLEIVTRTDTGLVRAANEDAVAVSAAHGLAVLADGMGGYSAGEVASNIATTVICQTVEKRLGKRSWRRAPGASAVRQLLASAVEFANDAILVNARRQPEHAGMGTTLVVALFHHDQVTIAHVGDSRAYRLRQGRLEQLTHDHSLLQEELDAGLISPEQARFADHKNLVTRAVGIEPALAVEIHEHQIAAGDLYLLCSDGLSDMLAEEEIAELAQGADLPHAAEALVQRANQLGGYDNISVILARVLPQPHTQRPSQHQSGAVARSGLLAWLAHWIK